MAIKGRQSLYSIFINGAVPTQQDFADLIDSTLNKRDDHFFGKWQKGMKYCLDDVVIYEKSLYKLIMPNKAKPCEEEDNGNGNGNENGTGIETQDGCYCSDIVPPLDKEHWCLLELDLKDRDWEIVFDPEDDPEGKVDKIYQMTAKVGIGTDEPQAHVDISNGNKILLEPDSDGGPAIDLLKISPVDDELPASQKYARYILTESVCWESDAMAYVFKLAPEQMEAEGEQVQASRTATKAAPSELMMIIKYNANNVPQVGIGIDAPIGGLHVRENNRGDVILNPGVLQEPGILVANLEADNNGYFMLTGVNNEHCYFSTNSKNGFHFKKSELSQEDLLTADSPGDDKSLVAILGNGRVGIGTEAPKSNMEITDSASGSFRFQLGDTDIGISNPALNINNLRPDDPEYPNTYLTMGVDSSTGVFITDAPEGFVFKAGDAYGGNNEVDINQGDAITFITRDGKVGVKTSDAPEDYDLDVNGQTRSMMSYLATNGNNIKEDKEHPFKDANILEELNKLHPMYFTWKAHTGLAGEGKQIGFKAEGVAEVFPELVKNSEAIAYGSLTAVLVQAIKDQQVMIKEMEQRIADLEGLAKKKK